MSELEYNGADEYHTAIAAGAQSISKSWRWLADSTRIRLTQTRRYNASGTHENEGGTIEKETSRCQEEQIDDFEYNIGILALALEAKLPGRQEPGVPISSYVLRDEVLSAAAALLYNPYGRDATFLRKALLAVRRHQIANLLVRLPALKNEHAAISIGRTIIYLIGFTGIFLASPAILASVLVAATQGNFGDTSWGLYALGMLAMMWGYSKNQAKENEALGTIDEQTYLAWIKFDPYIVGDLVARGAGAKTYLEDMVRRGQPVPPLMIDLCETLVECTRHSYERPRSATH